MLRETGYLSREEIDVNGTKIKPIELSAKLLFPMWKLNDDENELTVLRVTVTGKKDRNQVKYTYDMLTYRDFKENNSSMARTTGFPCAIMAKMVAEGEFRYDGVCPPEYIGQNHKIFKKLLKELEERGVVYRETIEIPD
jgi:saccharopine dehydrogenase-like NADP-dependent oxidoreductase